jgi:tyrosyl-tRNA synthetase
MKSGLDILRERGFVAQVTFEDELEKLFQSGEMITYYTGFDPTADSLHIGHYIPIMAMSHLQKAGHRPIALMGAGTAMVGDPSGKTDLRRMLTVEDIDLNALAVKKQMERFLDGDVAGVPPQWLVDPSQRGRLRAIRALPLHKASEYPTTAKSVMARERVLRWQLNRSMCRWAPIANC